ncbi:MAG: hypothetical protein WA673_09670 [Candidatus Acidiferrales bacterium]
MIDEEFHISDQDLLRAADGELPRRRARKIEKHLAYCWMCRTRLRDIETAIADFVQFHRDTLISQLPPAAGSRALLKAQLAELAAKPALGLWPQLLQFIRPLRAVAYVCIALFLAALGGEVLLRHSQPQRSPSSAALFDSPAMPNNSLTPGVTLPVTVKDVCAVSHEEVVREVPPSLRQQVLREYGLANARAGDYEIDFLIAPRLGGAQDIRNLWPEPYALPAWNAHTKDVLEERLHQLVCEGKIDLPTAQHDIAANWIAAYQKYFPANPHASAYSPQRPSVEAGRKARRSSAINSTL